MSLRESLADVVRDRQRSNISIVPAKQAGIAATSGSPAISTIVPGLSSGNTGLSMSNKKAAGTSGMAGKNGVGFPKKASMATGGSGIKGPTKLGKDIRGTKGSM